jgi:formylglycine-generating enzyme required for sulfatase activity
MPNQRVGDITERVVLGEQFPLRLMQLGFRLMQAMDAIGRDQFRYVLPPVCAVPAGPFLMGSDQRHDPDAWDDELPQHTIDLPTFHIGTYPLTVAEYACCVQATRCAAPRRVE